MAEWRVPSAQGRPPLAQASLVFFWQDLLRWGRASWARPPHRGRARAGGGQPWRAATLAGCGGGNAANSKGNPRAALAGATPAGATLGGATLARATLQGARRGFFVKKILFFFFLSLSLSLYIYIYVYVNLGGGNPGGALAGATSNGNLDRALQASGAHMALEALLRN